MTICYNVILLIATAYEITTNTSGQFPGSLVYNKPPADQGWNKYWRIDLPTHWPLYLAISSMKSCNQH